MAKKTTASTAARKRRPAPAKKVWHIFHFEERFELADDSRKCRKGALLFIRCVVSPNDDESINLDEQLRSLRCFAAEGLEEVLLEGCFWRLTKAAANRSRVYRGYLLDERYQPATAGRIGMWLGLDAKRTAEVLKCLEKAGLIERVNHPEFAEEEDDPETPPPADETPKGPKKTDRKKTAVKGPKTQKKTNSAEGRKNPPAFKKGEHEDEPRPSASEERENENKSRPSASEGKKNAAAQQRPSGAACGPCEALAGQGGNGTAEAEGRAQGEREANLRDTAGGDSQTETPLSPAATPPRMPSLPTEAERLPGGDLAEQARMAQIAVWNERFRDYGGGLFAESVFRAIKAPDILKLLKVPPDEVEREGNREYGSYAGYWRQVLAAGLDRRAMMDLWEKGIRRAQQIGSRPLRVINSKGKKGQGNPFALWRYEADQRFKAARHANEARASPLAGAV